MNALLLDTNIWLDYHFPIRPGHADAFNLIDTAYRADIALLIAPHSVKDFWYISWQMGKRANMQFGTMEAESASRSAKVVAWAAAKQICEIATVVGTDMGDTLLAFKLQDVHDDLEDNLVVAAALRAKPRLLITNDQTLLAHCPVAAATAKDALTFQDL